VTIEPPVRVTPSQSEVELGGALGGLAAHDDEQLTDMVGSLAPLNPQVIPELCMQEDPEDEDQMYPPLVPMLLHELMNHQADV